VCHAARKPMRFFRKRYRRFLLGLLFGLSLFGPPLAWAENSAVIFIYHRFGEDDFPSTSIKIEQFEAHMEELKTGGYNVMALGDIIKAFKNGDTLPEKAVALTIDEAYLSAYEKAWPKFRELGFPFTVFVSSDPVDMGIRGYMSWDQLREMDRGGATIGNHTVSHLHMTQASLSDNRSELDNSGDRLLNELGYKPDLIAYPYGESSERIGQLVRSSGFIAAFGQHSGAAAKLPNMFYLPRFSLNEEYGDIDRFRLAANSIALKVEDVTPGDPLVDADDENPPAFGFTVTGDKTLTGSLNQLSCFSSHEGKLDVSRLGGESGQTRIEIRMQKPLPNGRTRLNCTLPAGNGRWYWFGHQFYTNQ